MSYVEKYSGAKARRDVAPYDGIAYFVIHTKPAPNIARNFVKCTDKP